MSTVGAGVRELRIHAGREYRVFYITRFTEGVFVVHASEKRTRRTPPADIAIARRRLRELTRPRALA